MKITCQSCQSKYNVADDKVQGKIVKIRCRKCGSTIVVQGNAGAAKNGAATETAGAALIDGDVQWHVNVGDADPRTMPLAELIEAYNAGTVTQDTFIWTDGMDDWKPLSEVETVVSALHANAPAGSNGSAAEAAFRAPVEEAPAAAPAYEAPAAFAAPAPVFAAPAPAPEEPRRAAVAKREARSRDLFGGSGSAGEDVQTSAPANPQMMSAPADDTSKLTGQRNENSVLFSLAVLTKDADDRAPENEPAATSTARSNEDSGLIDLKALAAKAESMRPAASADSNAFASPLGLGLGGSIGSPLGMGNSASDAPAKSKLPLLIGGGAGVAILLVLGIVIGVKLGGSSSAGTAPTTTASAAPVPTATAEPTAAVTATAEPSATVTASASAAPKPKPVAAGPAYHPPQGGAKPAGGTPTGATPAGPTPPPPKKPGNDCGCNGDLMCLMKCSTH